MYRFLPLVGGLSNFHGVYSDPDPAAAAAEQALKDAQFARDNAIAEAAKLKKQIDELSGKVLSEDERKLFDTLKKERETAEEARKRKEGEFDTLKQQLVDKHNAEIAALNEKLTAATNLHRSTLISREFAGASALFGGTAEAKTVLTHDVAEAYFGRYVEPSEDGKSIVVKNLQGQVILDPKTGKPADFATAMTELIGALPNKDNILRGSGKAGSGSSGGADTNKNGQIDTTKLKPADFKDPKVREAVKAEHAAAGGIVMGSALKR